MMAYFHASIIAWQSIHYIAYSEYGQHAREVTTKERQEAALMQDKYFAKWERQHLEGIECMWVYAGPMGDEEEEAP